tara:strand:- start:906 stop:1010 length:105 start_codon:yes stop_codon:yes gene_type:complete
MLKGTMHKLENNILMFLLPVIGIIFILVKTKKEK